MTSRQLEEYRDLRAEVKALRDRLDKMKPGIECDTVRGSSPVFPYVEHTITLRGYSEQALKRYNRLVRRYQWRYERHLKSLEEIERWIDTVTDPKVRLLVGAYYIDGKTWRATAKSVYGSPRYESAARMRVERYLKNNL